MYDVGKRKKMLTTNLRKVGGSVMLAVPRAILDIMRVEAGATVRLAMDGERLIIVPQKKPRYTLEQLLDQCKKGSGPVEQAEEDRVWINQPSVGREL